ncbi:MAG: cupin domain-containing protein [Nannocystaceae bacterium]
MSASPRWSLDALLGEAECASLIAAMSAGEAHLVRGAADRFDGLFDEARLRGALARIAAAPEPGGPRFGALVRDPLGDGLTFTEALEVAAIDEALAAGHTICATDVAPADPALAEALAELQRSIACAGDLRFNAYLSPTGARTALHTDVRISTSLQLSGRKRWRFQRRAASAYPLSNAQIDRFGDVHWMNPIAGAGEPLPPPDRAELEEVVLAPGDLLSVPAGAWHEVVTEERGLGLNLSVRPTNIAALLHLLIDAAFAGSGPWRSGLPIVARSADGVPPAIARTVGARVDELRRWLEGLDPAGDEVAALWRSLVGR